MADARTLAFRSLSKIFREKSYSNITIAGALRSSDLSGADKSFFTALVYGVLERKVTLDYNLSRYLQQPIGKLNPKVYTALLLGAYQVLFMEKVPSHAAVNETVRLVKKNGAGFAAGLVNAVLHKLAQNGVCYPDPPARELPEDGALTEAEWQYLSVYYSVPEPLLKRFVSSYGLSKTTGLLEDALGPRPLTVRVNTTRTSAEALKKRLSEEGVNSEAHPFAEDALMLEDPGDLSALPSFREGLFHVQDAASQLCCKALDPQPGETVFDVCAAPGGKSCTLAERMENNGVLKAFDLYESRVGLIRENASRLGLSIVSAEAFDATKYDPSRGLADRILCDVPCSGTGDIGRKPEVRFKDPGLVDNLSPLQYDILNITEQYLKAGGTLVYSTCALDPAENEDVVARFLSEHPDFVCREQKTCFPQDWMSDGFFYAVLEKEREL